ncbi:MAG TPA: TRAP transporter TatT component family protein [Minicystis sp.]|nr:TRAP transporter TatT component family protein [Minicystis sp.]
MRAPLAAALLALSVAQTGCIKQMLLDGQIEATRKASAAVDTISDYEVAQSAAFAGIAQFEGMHYLAPDNEDALFMLTKSWAGATFGFIEDLMEQAEDAQGSDSPLYAYEQARARAGYDRAIHYGVELLEHKNKGFSAAKRNDETMKAWLSKFTDKDDAAALFWTGNAWMSKTNVIKEDPAAVAELFVGVDMMERAVALDPGYMNGSGFIALGAYHARSPLAELPEGKKDFDKAIAMTGGKYLMAKFQLAAKYYCTKGDKDAYVKTLTEVVQAGDVFPEERLTNTIAKRRASRYLTKPRMRACGF